MYFVEIVTLEYWLLTPEISKLQQILPTFNFFFLISCLSCQGPLGMRGKHGAHGPPGEKVSEAFKKRP